MQKYCIRAEQIAAFVKALRDEDRSSGTIEKYSRDVRAFAAFLEAQCVTKELATAWREHLLACGYAPVTVNAMVAAINKFFSFLGWERLVAAACTLQKERLALLMEAICATGIRVSELKYLTVESASRGRAEIRLKGKIRIILLPGKLCRKLLKYARKQKIASGEIFLTRGGKGINRIQIWAEMKSLCKTAGVEPSKVFPHNLRHLFARTFYKICRDVAKLADILGHSSIDTTRMYLVSTGSEHMRELNRLHLIS